MPRINWSIDVMQMVTIVVMLLGFAGVAGQFKADMVNFKEAVTAIRQDNLRLSEKLQEVQLRLEHNQTVLDQHVQKTRRYEQ